MLNLSSSHFDHLRLERVSFAAMHGITCYTCPLMSGLGVKPMRRREFITWLGGALTS
jgi:hypothetical protein